MAILFILFEYLLGHLACDEFMTILGKFDLKLAALLGNKKIALLCFALLCFALLCFTLLCFALLCFALLCYAMLCFDSFLPSFLPSFLDFRTTFLFSFRLSLSLTLLSGKLSNADIGVLSAEAETDDGCIDYDEYLTFAADIMLTVRAREQGTFPYLYCKFLFTVPYSTMNSVHRF